MVKNMKKLFDYYMKTGKRLLKYDRRYDLETKKLKTGRLKKDSKTVDSIIKKVVTTAE